MNTVNVLHILRFSSLLDKHGPLWALDASSVWIRWGFYLLAGSCNHVIEYEV